MTTITIEENLVLPKTKFKTVDDMQNFMVFFLKNNNKVIKQERISINNFIRVWKKKTISDFIGIWSDIPKNINYKDIASEYLYAKYLKND